jgi:threonine dehydrogenase-like Zn-dependent dehydrogenase
LRLIWGDHTIRTALCTGGRERMRRVMNVIQGHRLDLGGLVTHQWKLLFANQRDGVLKIAIKP